MSDGKVSVLIVNGIGNTGTVDVFFANSFGKISYNTSGSCNTFGFLPRELKKNHFVIDHLEQQEISIKHILTHDIIFCEISDPDSHSMALKKAQHLFGLVKDKIPWINDPNLVLNTRRDTMSQLLSGIDGVIAPKALRLKPLTIKRIEFAIASNEFSLPVLIRPSGSHGGKNLVLIKSLAELKKVDLSNYEDAFITEYVDFESNNVFTKYRFAVVAGEPILRHVIFSDDWIIHSESRNYMADNPQFQELEAEIIENFEHDLKLRVEGRLHEIYKKIGLDYFGIDCAIRNDQIILFEVNANMNMLTNNQPKPNVWEKQIETIIQKLVDNLIVARVKNQT